MGAETDTLRVRVCARWRTLHHGEPLPGLAEILIKERELHGFGCGLNAIWAYCVRKSRHRNQ